MRRTRIIAPLIAALFTLLIGVWAAGVAPVPALAQGKYPSRTIEVVVPFAPGGGTDNLMRTIVAIIEENKWSPQAINVVNRAGGSGVVGYTYLINKKGDPHVVAGAAPTIVSARVEGRLSAGHRDGMTTLMIVAIDELMLSVRTESKFQTIEDFVKEAKERPGQLTVAGTGTNSEDHIFTYLLEKAAGIKVKYVPFQSGGECTAALMGGHVDAGVMNPNEIIAQIDAKKARNLAVAAKKRMPDAADLPTFAEKGYEFYWEQMRGVVGTAGMPAEAVQWWQETLKKVVGTQRWKENYIKRNLLTPTAWVGEEADQYLDSLRDKYVKALGDLGALKK
jgi:putative tricarboxylic transport membrane protein